MIDIKKTLDKLNISKENMGTSTGNSFFGSGPQIESYSPVDGELIGSVCSTTRNDYDRVVLTAQEAFRFWRRLCRCSESPHCDPRLEDLEA